MQFDASPVDLVPLATPLVWYTRHPCFGAYGTSIHHMYVSCSCEEHYHHNTSRESVLLLLLVE